MIRARVLLALVAGCSAKNPQCKEMKVIPAQDFLDSVATSFEQVVSDTKDVQTFVQSKPDCQHACFHAVLPASVKSLIGLKGDDLIKPETQKVAIEAFTGAFRTCFPSPARELVLKLMTDITDHMGPAKEKKKPPAVTSKGKCPGTKGDKDAFMKHAGGMINSAMQKVTSADKGTKDFFDNVMLACQGECLSTTIEQAFSTSWDMGDLGNGALVTSALEGAFKSCLPGQPYEQIQAFVKALNEAAQAHEEDAKRLLLASSAAGPTKDEIASMVGEHNKFRKTAGSPPLVWDDALAKAAQSWAAAGHSDHSTALGAFKKYGENIHMSCPKDTPVTACKWWHDEISKYAGGDSLGAPHYTQMVWKGTTKFGCGKGPASCKGDLWVCQYLPMGNFIGKFKDNVPQKLYDLGEYPEMLAPVATENNMHVPLAFAAVVGGALVAMGVVVGRRTAGPIQTRELLHAEVE